MADQNMNQQINQNVRARQQVTALAFASKYKSKREVYNFLAIEVKAYLPSYDCLTIYYLKDLVNGTKRVIKHDIILKYEFFLQVIKSDAIQHLTVPQYDSLKVDNMIEIIEQHPEVYKYLPDRIEIKKIPKQYLVNVLYTIIKAPFGAWVKQQIEERNRRIAVDKNMLIDMDPEIAEAYAASTAVSSRYSGFYEAFQF